MKNIIPFLCFVLVASLMSGCGIITNIPDSDIVSSDTNSTTITPSFETDDNAQITDTIDVSGDKFTDRDSRSEYDELGSIKVHLNGTGATANHSSVKISGSTITLTSAETTIISGTLDDGMIIVDTSESSKMQIVLNGVTISSKASAALYIKEADKVFVTLKDENTLENGGEFKSIDETNIDAAVFSKQDITFNGMGTLNVNSPVGHGIVGKDDVVFTNGTYNIASASHAINANDSIRIKNATVTADAGKDGIHAENNNNTDKGYVYIESGTFNIECEGDGISSSAYIQIAGGEFYIHAGGGHENGTKESSGSWGDFGGGFGGGGGKHPGQRSNASTSFNQTSTTESSASMKGIKSEESLTIGGGVFTIDSADDAIHSNTSLILYDGIFEIASGDDGIHAEENLEINGGVIKITDSYEGLEALHVTINGGEIKLKSSDDGINAAGGNDQSGNGGRDNMFGGFGGFRGNSNGSIKISGGTIYIEASGDGLDANGTLDITGGYTTVCGPTSGDTAVLDYDKTATITGGTFVGTGSSMMAQSFSSSMQGVIALSVGNRLAGSEIKIFDEFGNEILSYSPELSFQILVFSSPELVSGELYSVSVGSAKGNFKAN